MLQSLLLSFIVLLVFGVLFRMISAHTIEPRAAERNLADAISAYQEYVSDNELSRSDTTGAHGWTNGSAIVLPIGASLLEYELDGRFSQTTADIIYSDGVAEICVVYFVDRAAYAWGILIIGCISAVVFFGRFYFLLNRKLNYISEIENGVNILESGDLSYQLAVLGEDELSRLAVSINEMSSSLAGRIETEKQALLSGREMIGDLSHDIRTPLTILSGYIPLLLESEPLTDTQREYLELMDKKTGQMRRRVDELLDYATIYSGQRKPQKRTLSARALVEQFSSELVHFNPAVENRIGDDAIISADPELLDRVFDNLISNLHKHADTAQPVSLSCRLVGQRIEFELENSIAENAAAAQGNTMGHKIVEYIMQLHGGSVAVRQKDKHYAVTLTFPMMN